MTTVLPMPTLSHDRSAVIDAYGNARLPASAFDARPERIDKIPYGRFRNVYLYITEACQLRCEHCYMGERLERALKMPYEAVMKTLTTWRQMGGSKLTMPISLDGGSSASHDQVRGAGTFDQALATIAGLCRRGFDTRIICTVNKANLGDCLNLLDIADELGVSLVKYHVFSVIGSGHGAAEWGIHPAEWIEFYERLEQVGPGHKTRIWYQPTYPRRERMAQYAADGYRGCIGRTMDRISIFPDGRAYVCSFLFDTDLHFANMIDGQIVLNKDVNEFDLFTRVLSKASCGSCKVSGACMGGCPAEELVMGAASCTTEPDIVPVCRLWKADVPTTPAT